MQIEPCVVKTEEELIEFEDKLMIRLCELSGELCNYSRFLEQFESCFDLKRIMELGQELSLCAVKGVIQIDKKKALRARKAKKELKNRGNDND